MTISEWLLSESALMCGICAVGPLLGSVSKSPIQTLRANVGMRDFLGDWKAVMGTLGGRRELEKLHGWGGIVKILFFR